jgi:hypothetical protein
MRRPFGEASGRSTLEGRAKATAKEIADQIKPRLQPEDWIQQIAPISGRCRWSAGHPRASEAKSRVIVAISRQSARPATA